MSRLLSSKSEYSGSVMNEHSKYVYLPFDYDTNNGSCVDPVDFIQSNGDELIDSVKTKSQSDLAELINGTGMFQKIDDNYDPRVIRQMKNEFFNKLKNQKNGRRTSRSLNRKEPLEESSHQVPTDGPSMSKSQLMAEFIRTYGTPV